MVLCNVYGRLCRWMVLGLLVWPRFSAWVSAECVPVYRKHALMGTLCAQQACGHGVAIDWHTQWC
jgi:hypothetical protein